MSDILLIEPGYKNKYPPMGLMKIAYFHKYIHHDNVRFAKGKLPDAFKDKKWDRVYVTTLFTFEWENTKKAIEYALSVAKDPHQVYTGGILATLMPDLIAETFPTVKNNPGLLNVKGTLGLEHEECIDTLPLDYDILKDIQDEYVYPAHDAYFTYMTRGCGMKCQFCAVQTLEPQYIPYLSITESIKRIDKEYGPKKDLLLMDNNVLRSPQFDQIIDEVKALGFAKGATYSSPKTGKPIHRYVDFNQGLDAFLLTPHKAERLGELAIRPARIAFDHIEDKDAYIKAIKLCAKNGITHMSNYLLYNGEEFKGKGHSYKADSPEDLYERMRISLDLCDEILKEYNTKITIFSFPMRYIPLSDLKRGFVGTHWCMKYLRALQRMLIPTQGKGVSSRSFFEADFGKTAEEFVEALAMPEEHLGWRGHFVEKKDEPKKERAARYKLWEENHSYINEWRRLFRSLDENQRKEFIGKIGDNNFSAERFETITDPVQQKLFIHYFTLPATLRILSSASEDACKTILAYMKDEFPIMYKRLIEYASRVTTYSMLEGLFKYEKGNFVAAIFATIDVLSSSNRRVVNNLKRVQDKLNLRVFDFDLINVAYLYMDAGIITKKSLLELRVLINSLDEKGARELLKANFPKFTSKLKKQIKDQPGNEYLIKEAETLLLKLNKQLSMFGDDNED